MFTADEVGDRDWGSSSPQQQQNHHLALQHARSQIASVTDDLGAQRARREAEVQRLVNDAEDALLGIEQCVAVEAKRRAEADIAMTDFIERTMRTAAEAVYTQIDRRLSVTEHCMRTAIDKVGDIEGTLHSQRERDESLAQELRKLSAQLAASALREIESERALRVEFTSGYMGKMQGEIARLQAQLAMECDARAQCTAIALEEARRVGRTDRPTIRPAQEALLAELRHAQQTLAAVEAQRMSSTQNFIDIMTALVDEARNVAR